MGQGLHVLLTGATGFLGKVVLEQLVRHKKRYGIQTVSVLIRPKKGATAHSRLQQEIVRSDCFARCPKDWADMVMAVDGNLTAPQAGIAAKVRAPLLQQVTHIIHCAASVDFDRPLAEAAESNIVSTLNLLELARAMPNLRHMVATSTAYVTPWRKDPIAEVLPALPRPVAAMWQDVQGGVEEKQLLAETGHANTYTYTKCLAEHLLQERRGNVPVTVVRPSIISASWREPFAGWIDSKAAFAGFVVTIGAGILRVIDANPNTKLDLVPVDTVAQVLVREALQADEKRPLAAAMPIVYAVAGRRHGAHIGATSAAIVRYFRRHRVARRPNLSYLGGRNARFVLHDALEHKLTHALHALRGRLLGDVKVQRQASRLQNTIATINTVFPYFTHHTFDFVAKRPIDDSFNVQAYVDMVCRGAATHLMRRNPRRVLLTGGARRTRPALPRPPLWRLATGRPQAWTQPWMQEFLRLTFDEVSFDETSFLAAKEAFRAGVDVVVVTAQRSGMDAALCGQLFATHPDLGLAGARVVEDGGDGQGVARQLATATQAAQTRAGSKAPRAQVLILRQTGQPTGAAGALALPWLRRVAESPRPVLLLPVAISYEHDPSLLPFVGQIPGVDAGALLPKQLLPWLARQRLGKRPRLGPAHLVAGSPIFVPSAAASRQEAEGHLLAQSLAQALRVAQVATVAQLQIFVACHPHLGLEVEPLRRTLEARGIRVLPAPKRPRNAADARSQTALGALGAARGREVVQGWSHAFSDAMLERWPHAACLAHYFGWEPEGFRLRGQNAPEQTTSGLSAQAEAALVAALATPIAADYRAVGQAVTKLLPSRAALSCEQLLDVARCQDRAVGERAVALLTARGVLRAQRVADAQTICLTRLPHTQAALQHFLAGTQLEDLGGQAPLALPRLVPLQHGEREARLQAENGADVPAP